MDSFFGVLYGLFLLDLYVLFLLGSIWALSFGFYEGSFFWILYRLFLLDSIWALSFGFYIDLFFWGYFLQSFNFFYLLRRQICYHFQIICDRRNYCIQHNLGPKIVPCLTISFTSISFVLPIGVLITILASLFIS